MSVILQSMFVYIRNLAQMSSVISENTKLQMMTNAGDSDDWNVEDKTTDSSLPEYAPLSPLTQSGSESQKEENSFEGDKEIHKDEHDIDNADCAEVTVSKLLKATPWWIHPRYSHYPILWTKKWNSGRRHCIEWR